MDTLNLKEVISTGDTTIAISLVKEYIFSNIKYQSLINPILLIQAEFQAYKSNELKGLSQDISLNEIHNRLLELVDKIDKIDKTNEVVRLSPPLNNEPINSTRSYIFKKIDSEIYNKDFYTHFNSVLANAKNEILITGEGFRVADSLGKKILKDFVDSIELALINPSC